MMEFLAGLLIKTAQQVWITFTHNWPFLVVSVLIAVAMKLYINPNQVSAFLMRYRKAGVLGATVAAVATPLCSCGTTAIILGMMASTIPWAPIIAFMVASPLTSPEELIYSAGLFGWPFALAFFLSSIILGLVGGMTGEFLEQRGWLVNQSRFSERDSVKTDRAPAEKPGTASQECACSAAPSPVFTARTSRINRPQFNQPSAILLVPAGAGGEIGLGQSACCTAPVQSRETCSCAGSNPGSLSSQIISSPVIGAGKPDCACDPQPSPAITAQIVLAETLTTGKRLLVMFLGFAFIGYFLNGLIPAAWVARLFGSGNIYSVPLAATLGLPLYINTEASLPLVRALIDGGMSQGAAMAFMITGAGTSIGALAGALTIARWRVIAVVVGTLWAGAIVTGMVYNVLLSSGIF